MIDYSVRLFRRFREERFAQLSASLAFTTILSLVPIVAVTVAVGNAVPFMGPLVGQLDNFLLLYLLPDKTGTVVVQYTYRFSQQASRLTAPGIVMLVVASLILMFSIERAFNHLWRVKRSRSVARRSAMYVAALFCGPLLAGALLSLAGYAASVLVGVAGRTAWFTELIKPVTAMALMCGFFSLLYGIVPATRVRLAHALIGGLVATVGIFSMQRIFGYAVGQFGAYKTLYGAFAVLPMFLLWIYLCWAIVLIGAVVTANFSIAVGERQRYRQGAQVSRSSSTR